MQWVCEWAGLQCKIMTLWQICPKKAILLRAASTAKTFLLFCAECVLYARTLLYALVSAVHKFWQARSTSILAINFGTHKKQTLSPISCTSGLMWPKCSCRVWHLVSSQFDCLLYICIVKINLPAWFRGVVGDHVRLTRERSRVRNDETILLYYAFDLTSTTMLLLWPASWEPFIVRSRCLASTCSLHCFTLTGHKAYTAA